MQVGRQCFMQNMSSGLSCHTYQRTMLNIHDTLSPASTAISFQPIDLARPQNYQDCGTDTGTAGY
jgi:hypothetical protein